MSKARVIVDNLADLASISKPNQLSPLYSQGPSRPFLPLLFKSQECF
jgi:hypothetical protein